MTEIDLIEYGKLQERVKNFDPMIHGIEKDYSKIKEELKKINENPYTNGLIKKHLDESVIHRENSAQVKKDVETMQINVGIILSDIALIKLWGSRAAKAFLWVLGVTFIAFLAFVFAIVKDKYFPVKPLKTKADTVTVMKLVPYIANSPITQDDSVLFGLKPVK